MELVRGKFKAMWIEDEAEVLCFVIFQKKDGEWDEVDSLAMPTDMPPNTPPETLRKGLELILENISRAVKNSPEIDDWIVAAQKMSYMEPSWFEEEDALY